MHQIPYSHVQGHKCNKTTNQAVDLAHDQIVFYLLMKWHVALLHVQEKKILLKIVMGIF